MRKAFLIMAALLVSTALWAEEENLFSWAFSNIGMADAEAVQGYMVDEPLYWSDEWLVYRKHVFSDSDIVAFHFSYKIMDSVRLEMPSYLGNTLYKAFRESMGAPTEKLPTYAKWKNGAMAVYLEDKTNIVQIIFCLEF